ncbi:MAG TPA: twin-arginine translocation signal domain-containing protein [Myxococcota bacterium]|nr:twin-arginine translocation signal domain-containing protein [Myxococcota bacterium]HRY97079.1 twin-arginine translocation signal domain-containing protein [Myxococcota bacterium]HSA21118.1 twin-arginine translocation signal domain-containing protein [Myxococcota bacterium]
MDEKSGFSRRDLLKLLGSVTVAAGAGSVVATLLPGCGEDQASDLPAGCSLLSEETVIDLTNGYAYEVQELQCQVDQPALDCYCYTGDYVYYSGDYHAPVNGRPCVCVRSRLAE